MSEATKAPRATMTLSIFEPDILTTHGFLKQWRQTSLSHPEERLMFAVLSDAIECFQKYLTAESRTSRKLFKEAEAWIDSKESNWPYSFEQICDVLNLDSGYLRVGLTRWRLTHELQKSPRKRLREPLRYQYRVRHNRVCI